MATNRLASETSPYLLQHQHNPVDWHPWGEEAFEKARREMKLLFLSIGYSACHWCHVMERESFENEEIGTILNQHFVAVKVDREERPDVDALYMDAVQRMTGHGGWPLSAFLLPDGRPVYGGTYFPPDDRYGRPGFRRILETLAQMWHDDPQRLVDSAAQVSEGLDADLMAQADPGSLDPDVPRIALEVLTGEIDPVHGGFGSAPKFPQAANLGFMLAEHISARNMRARDGVLHTLRKMAEGGIYDHLGGGFHRYATDEYWLVPHFEKMLYDNALLTRCYLQAFRLTGEDPFRRVAEETMAYVTREMTSDEGGFYTAQDADSEGVEGKFFVWSLDEVVDVLGERDGLVFAARYDVTRDGNWEGHNILNARQKLEQVADEFDLTVDEVQSILSEAKAKLLEVRARRVKPGLDDKCLTAWNAMMLSAFVEAYQTLGKEQYLEVALRNSDFIRTRLADESTGRLWHTHKNGRSTIDAFVDDYAYLAEAWLNLFEASGDGRWLERCRDLADQMIERFWDDESGGFYYTTADTELIARRKELMDNAMPSGNSVAVYLLARLAIHTDRSEYREKSERVLSVLGPAARKYPGAFGYLLQAYGFLVHGPLEIAVVGPDARKYLDALHEAYIPYSVLAWSEAPDDTHPLLRGKRVDGHGAAAFVCEGYACREPAYEVEDFRKQIDLAIAGDGGVQAG